MLASIFFIMSTNELVKTIDEIRSDQKTARKEFEFHEKVYRTLSESSREYLKPRSYEYKKYLAKTREMISPVVREKCSVCRTHCCMLHNPERSIYMAGAVGGFFFIDYLLIRYNTILPEPNYQNVEKNLCPFWDHGCILPADSRSYLCIRYFCDEIKEELDMQQISRYLEKVKSILNDFSIGKFMPH